MWPEMFGPGWGWGLAAACGAFLGAAAIMWSALRGGRTGEPQADQLLEVWRRYEQGDLLRSEFERFKAAIAADAARTARPDRGPANVASPRSPAA